MTKYEMIIQDIKEKIERREYQSNQVLPSENELCQMYGVSRITVRKAIEELIAEGILYRVGKKGSFVCDTENSVFSHIYSFTEAITRQGQKPGKNQLSMEKIKAGSAYAGKLRISADESVYVLRCLYLADGKPYCLNTSILPEKLFPKLEFFDFNDRSLYEILKSFYGLSMSRSSQKISAVLAESDICKPLQVPEKQPLLHIDAKSYCRIDGEEVVFECYESYILTDVLTYSVEKYS